MSYREIKVFGPPGTGKTTWACRQIERAQIEYGPDRVLVTSFTKTAAGKYYANKVVKSLPSDRLKAQAADRHEFY
jgi:superfamily I DNA/RNA helicase